jgi:PAS domain S-box-containing protein
VTFRVPVADGECRHFESWGRPAGEDGTYHTLVGASRDVTDEHRALRAAQLRSLLLDSLGEGVSVARGDGTLVYVNAALERMLGYAPGELLGRPVRMLSSRSQADYDLRASQITGVIDARGHWSGPMTSRRKDGALLQTYGTITRAVVDGEPLWITVRQDMTERHRVQRDLLAASQREKEQLAHALHESLAQQLTGTALLAGSMRDEAARRDSALAPAVSRLADLLLEAVGTCRRLAQGVSGFSVRNGGLDLGLRELALAFERRHGGACEVEVDRGVAAALDPETARHLYWIAEDALAIAAREGDGPRAVLRLEPVDSGARLRVRLPGIAPERLEALGGAELKFIGYRAALLGAGMATRPAEGGGVSIDCLCPTGGKTGVLP